MHAPSNLMNDARARADLHRLFGAAVAAALPGRVMPERLPRSASGRLVVMAVGKAAAEMMRVARMRYANSEPFEGLVVTRHGHLPSGGCAWPGIEFIEAGHPSPDENSVRAGEKALEIATGLESGDHLLLLISGGGSALLCAPAKGLDLPRKQAVNRALLQSGATIEEINCVRKHLSRIKGGRLAVAASPAKITSWIISDVPGDDPSLVASGPAVADRTSLADARGILDKYRIAPSSAVAAALADPANETPSADSRGLAGSEALIIARPNDSLQAAAALARGMGYEVSNLGDRVEGEARDVGLAHAALAKDAAGGARRAIISGGETTVTVINRNGRGGRNLEYLLALAIGLDGAPGIHALACDTDGIDGTEDAAGAIVTPDTLARAGSAGLDPAAYLADNNAYLFFQRLGDLVISGPTLTNVNDFRVLLIEGGESSR
jgi:glycerate 2-kinase